MSKLKTKCLSEKKLIDITKTLLCIIYAKDIYTFKHSYRVAENSLLLGQSLGLSEKELKILKIGALLHDIGKIDISDEILLKKTKLNKYEYNEIKKHTNYGSNILSAIPNFNVYKDISLYHHERIDGKGYPCGLRDKDIPLMARIVAIADSYDAMTNNRPYRTKKSVQYAMKELLACSDTQFDKELVSYFIKEVLIKSYDNETLRIGI